jgi:hypothetical protein
VGMNTRLFESSPVHLRLDLKGVLLESSRLDGGVRQT